MWLDVGELVRILSAGVNVVATAAFITGHNLGADRDRIAEACQQGDSTMFGTGISPGFAELLAIVVGHHLRPSRQGHGQRGRRHDLLRLAGHRTPGAASANPSTIPSSSR